jgi:hypothetical protein
MSDTELIEKCVLIVLATAWVLVRYAKACECADCGEHYAIWTRAERQVCSNCRNEYDYWCRGKKRPKPKLWQPPVSRWEWIRRSLT